MLNSLVGILSGGGAGAAASSYESIATVVGNASASTITFSSIPSTYVALQVRFISRRNTGGNASNNALNLTFNGGGTSIYTTHEIQANGSTVASRAPNTNGNEIILTNGTAGSNQTANVMSVGILDIQDYKSTTRNKTIRYVAGNESNGVDTGYFTLSSGLYAATTAITSITFTNTNPFTTSSVFSLYGIKG